MATKKPTKKVRAVRSTSATTTTSTKKTAASAAKTRSTTKGAGSGTHIDRMSRDDFFAKVGELEQLASSVDQALQGFVSLTDEERVHTRGRFLSGESQALWAILSVAKFHPEAFRVLADKDNGDDPSIFETDLLAERLEMRNALASISNLFASASQRIADTVLHLGEQTKPVLLTAYDIAKPLAKHDREVRDLLSPALSFYARPNRKGAK
ncbi:MAG: hypothetical protein U0165_20775 [Polyangiaceae bacterium]